MGLPSFEGLAVLKSSVRITKAGDGLSEALKLEPVALHHGAEVLFVLRGRVTQVNHRPVEVDADELVRLHTVEAVEIAMVDESAVSAVEEILRVDRERVERAREEARKAEEHAEGIFDLDDAELSAAHEAGEHGELVEGCAECEDERAAVAAEKKAKK